MNRRQWAMTGVALVASVTMAGVPAASAQAAPHQSGTVKASTDSGLTLTTAAGQDYTVTITGDTKVLVVPPGAAAKDATAGTKSDVTTGDKAIVLGSAGDSGTDLKATKIYLMKSAAIAQSHAASEQAWTQGVGGIVKSVDVAGSKVTLSSGMKTITVVTTPSTIVRHYAGGSVNFADAKVAQLGDVKPGDQLRVRGTKAMDGLTITADEMVAGTFHNYSGLLTAVDATGGTVSLKDLASKKPVTVAITPNSNVKRLAPEMAQRIAARMKGGAQGAPAGGQGGAPGAGGQGGPGGQGGGARGGSADLAQMLGRLPAETIANLKTGEAVMIVATSDSSTNTAVTLVVGVDPLLTASPSGEMTLPAWNVGGGGEGGGEGGGR
jgi:transcription elongation factor